MNAPVQPPHSRRFDNACERFTGTVRTLAIGKGDVRSRLKAAYLLHLHLVQERDLPPELREDYHWIMAQLTRYKPELPGEGSVQATLRRIQRATGARIAERVWSIFRRLHGDM
jgi:hypothetical protein